MEFTETNIVKGCNMDPMVNIVRHVCAVMSAKDGATRDPVMRKFWKTYPSKIKHDFRNMTQEQLQYVLETMENVVSPPVNETETIATLESPRTTDAPTYASTIFTTAQDETTDGVLLKNTHNVGVATTRATVASSRPEQATNAEAPRIVNAMDGQMVSFVHSQSDLFKMDTHSMILWLNYVQIYKSADFYKFAKTRRFRRKVKMARYRGLLEVLESWFDNTHPQGSDIVAFISRRATQSDFWWNK